MTCTAVLIDPSPGELAHLLSEATGGGDLGVWRAEVEKLPRRREGHAAWRWREASGEGITLTWWTDATGRRHCRLDPRVEPRWSEELPLSPAALVHPERLVFARADGELGDDEPPRLLALCGCGLVAYLHDLNWMGNCCGPCHDRHADEGLDVQADDAALPRLRLEQKNEVRSMALAGDGTLVASGDGSLIRVWDTAAGRELGALEHGDGVVTELAFSADAALLAAVRRVGQRTDVEVWSPRTGELLRHWDEAASYSGLCFSPEGRVLVVPGSHGMVFIELSAEGTIVSRRLDSSCTAGHPAFAASGWPMVAVWRSEDGDAVFLWRHATGQPETIPMGGYRTHSALLSPDGSHLVASDTFSWDSPDQEPFRVVDLQGRGHSSGRASEPCRAIAIYPGPPWLLVTVSQVGTLSVWDLRGDDEGRQSERLQLRQPRPRPLVRLWGDAEWVDRLAISTDGRLLVTGGITLNDQSPHQGVLRLWPLRDILAAVGVGF